MTGNEQEMCAERTVRIRELNDAFRRSMTGGGVVVTRGVFEKTAGEVAGLLQAVSRFDDFDEGNDPWGEHDFGSLIWDEERVFWKIDYYDRDLVYGSPDPADPEQTSRVLTVMLAWEY